MMVETTLQGQYIELDGRLRSKSAEFNDEIVPDHDDIAEMQNMAAGLETLRLKMEMSAIRDTLDYEPPPLTDTRPRDGVSADEAIVKYLESEHFTTRSKSDFRLGDESGMSLKTLFTTSAGWTPRSPFSGIVAPAPLRNPTALNYITQLPTSEAAVVYMTESTHTSGANPVAEGAAASEAAYAYTTTTAQVRRFSAILPVTEEVLADVPQIQSLLQNNLIGDLERSVEAQVLRGNGTAPNFTGVQNTSGINDQAKGSSESTLDAIYKAKVLCIKNGFVVPDLLIIHPDDLQPIVLDKAVGSSEKVEANASYNLYPQGYMYGSAVSGPPGFMWGMRVLESTGVAANTALLGAFGSYCHLRDRQDVTFKFGVTGDQFKEGEMTIRADVRAAFYVLRAKAFAKITSI